MALSLQKALLALLLSLLALVSPAAGLKTAQLSHKSGNLTAELALTPAQQEQGLSGRPSLAANQGMLFVFGSDSQPGFWMKEMHFPLDLVWLTADQKIAQIDADVASSTYPKTYTPDIPIRYVLEVNAGYVAKNQLTIGDFIHFSLK